MKKIAVLVLIFVGVSFSGVSQENQTEQPERIKLYPSTHQSKNTLTPDQEIEQCEAQIEALDTKEAKIRSSVEDTKIATANGWFDQADKTRKELRARIEELKNKK